MEVKRLPQLENDVHGQIIPAELRIGEPLAVEIKDNDGYQYSCTFMRLSPLGGEFELTSSSGKPLQRENNLSITLSTSDQQFLFSSLSIIDIQSSKVGQMVGVRWAQENVSQQVRDNRKEDRWLCQQDYSPTFSCLNPVAYEDLLVFKVIEFSPTALRANTSLRNKLLLPGMPFQWNFVFPCYGQFICCLRINQKLLPFER